MHIEYYATELLVQYYDTIYFNITLFFCVHITMIVEKVSYSIRFEIDTGRYNNGIYWDMQWENAIDTFFT